MGGLEIPVVAEQEWALREFRGILLGWQHGVHWPQLSSSKKRIRLSAAPRTLSCCDRITMAAEPMKQPYFSSVPKSSGMLSIEAGRIPPDAPPGR